MTDKKFRFREKSNSYKATHQRATVAGLFQALGLRFSLPLLTISERKLGETSEPQPWHRVPAAALRAPQQARSLSLSSGCSRLQEPKRAIRTESCVHPLLELHESWERLLLVGFSGSLYGHQCGSVSANRKTDFPLKVKRTRSSWRTRKGL